MPTPAELRALTEQGKIDTAKREELERKEAEQKAREARMEKYAQDSAEANRQLINIEYDMTVAAKQGRHQMYLQKVHTSTYDRLEGVPRIIGDHLSKEGFAVTIVEEEDVNCEGPCYDYYLAVSW